MRLWRKTSLRGYIPWEAAVDRFWGNGNNYETAFRVYFEPCFIHFVLESTGPAPVFTPAQLFPPGAGETAYKTLITNKTSPSKGTNVKVDKYRPATEITLSSDYVWPWSSHKHLGVNWVPPPGTDVESYEDVHMYPTGKVYTDTWRMLRDSALHRRRVNQIEQTNGVLRGYTIGEFRASPKLLDTEILLETPAPPISC